MKYGGIMITNLDDVQKQRAILRVIILKQNKKFITIASTYDWSYKKLFTFLAQNLLSDDVVEQLSSRKGSMADYLSYKVLEFYSAALQEILERFSFTKTYVRNFPYGSPLYYPYSKEYEKYYKEYADYSFTDIVGEVSREYRAQFVKDNKRKPESCPFEAPISRTLVKKTMKEVEENGECIVRNGAYYDMEPFSPAEYHQLYEEEERQAQENEDFKRVNQDYYFEEDDDERTWFNIDD